MKKMIKEWKAKKARIKALRVEKEKAEYLRETHTLVHDQILAELPTANGFESYEAWAKERYCHDSLDEMQKEMIEAFKRRYGIPAKKKRREENKKKEDAKILELAKEYGYVLVPQAVYDEHFKDKE